MKVHSSMIHELVSKIVDMMVLEISKESQAEDNPDIKTGLQKAEDIIKKFKEQ
jgi:hypothetical protein